MSSYQTNRLRMCLFAGTGLLFGVLAVPESAQAQGRPDTRSMTCAQAQALVVKRGEVVLTTGAHTFDRFIADARYCVSRTMLTATAYAPTKDNKQCPVGKRCREKRNFRD